METKMLLVTRRNSDYKVTKRSFKIWRITKGETQAETGRLRLRLYVSGRLVPHGRSLCKDKLEAQSIGQHFLFNGRTF